MSPGAMSRPNICRWHEEYGELMPTPYDEDCECGYYEVEDEDEEGEESK